MGCPGVQEQGQGPICIFSHGQWNQEEASTHLGGEDDFMGRRTGSRIGGRVQSDAGYQKATGSDELEGELEDWIHVNFLLSVILVLLPDHKSRYHERPSGEGARMPAPVLPKEFCIMANGTFLVPEPCNEPIYDYAPGSPERAALEDQDFDHE